MGWVQRPFYNLCMLSFSAVLSRVGWTRSHFDRVVFQGLASERSVSPVSENGKE